MTYERTSLLCLIVARLAKEVRVSVLNRPGSETTAEMAVTLSLRKNSLASVVVLLFRKFLKPLSVNPKHLVAAVMLANDVLLPGSFLVFVVVTTHLFMIYW